MKRKVMARYLILITVLMIFVGAAWYFTKEDGQPRTDAVLAGLEVGCSSWEERSYEL